ncbi:DDE-type integrase/transposase/recombinase [Stieleria varia]|uniref:Integrase core domain protein n=1 Tax=Stieleria varia TaxID=2528005 RepID=A0A5C6AQ81_9BACT|nr:DDE-type integrase/transposase/recombinase [Stieleria varia]TWU01142.1 Integrase core domain protein [Stieleria varia]
MQYANQLWQADTMFGPHVDRRQTKLIAFIDDASRVLCHGEFFFEENVDSMVRAIRSAFYKRGLPEQLLVDNGSIYFCQEITLICARVGCILRHTAVRDAAAKGKIERFFRRVRDPFLIRLRGRKIVLRHERHRDGDVIVYEGGRRIGKARLLDAVANGMMRRKETS